MRLRVFTEPQQGATYEQLLGMALAAAEGGFDAFFRSDHYLAMNVDGRPGPTDAWVTLAGLARETRGLRLGTLVSSATFRYPGPLAITVAQVDAMSGGRVELGLGTGWYEAEHIAYGIPFRTQKERFERLEEQLEIITGLWSTPEGTSFDYEGRHYRLKDSPALPKPFQRPRPPVIIGGSGPVRTPALAARFADEYNSVFLSPGDARRQFEAVSRACEAAGRDPGGIRRSSAVVVCCGSSEAEVRRRAAAIGREVDELKTNGACGTPEEVAASLHRWREAGSQVAYLQFLDPSDTDHVRLVGQEVAPLLA